MPSLRSVVQDAEGDNRYMASELLDCPPTPAADIFSLGRALQLLCNLLTRCAGCTMYVMVWGIEVPCDGEKWEQLRAGVFQAAPEDRSPQLVGLVKAMLARDPNARPTAEQILAFIDLAGVSRFDFSSVFAVGSRFWECCIVALLSWVHEVRRSSNVGAGSPNQPSAAANGACG